MTNQPFIIEAPEKPSKGSPFRAAWMPGLLLALAGLLLLGLGGQVTQLACARPADQPQGHEARCTISRSLLGLVTLRSQAVERVHGAQVGRSCPKASCVYRVELVLEGGQIHPLTETYSAPEAEKIALADRINQAMRAGDFTVSQPPGLLGVAAPLALLAGGIFALLAPLWSARRRMEAYR